MTLFRKINGSWVAIANPMVKVGGTWKNTTKTFVNDNGTWKLVDAAGAALVDPPEIVIDNISGKYISVGVRLTDPAHDLDLRRIRVLAAIGTTYPTNPLGAGFYAEPDTLGGDEPWSDWYYNLPFASLNGPQIVPTRQSNKLQYKKFSPTYKVGDGLAPNTTYCFTAWAQDASGTWSAATKVSLKTGANTNTSLPSTRSAVLIPDRVGSIVRKTGAFIPGRAITDKTYAGFFDYGNQITDLLKGKTGAISGSVRFHRAGDDPYAPTALTYALLRSASKLADGTYLYNTGGSANLNATSKGQAVAKVVPKAWIDQARKGYWRGILISQYSLNPYATSQVQLSQAEDPYVGALYLRWAE